MDLHLILSLVATEIQMKSKQLGGWNALVPECYYRWASAKLDRKICQKGDYWLFILGVNNSGTTILSKILETHPSIRSLSSEGQFLTSAFPTPVSSNVPRLWSSRMDIFRWQENDNPRPALKAKRDWIKLYSKDKGILLEKSPPNTLRSLWLQRNFKPSRFLSIVRNPYAVCEGIRRRTSYSIEQAASHWHLSNKILLEDARGLEKNLLIFYEDLVENPNQILEEIELFMDLDEPFTPANLATIEAHSIDGKTLGVQNMNEESIKRLSNSDILVINSICGELMTQLSYPLINITK